MDLLPPLTAMGVLFLLSCWGVCRFRKSLLTSNPADVERPAYQFEYDRQERLKKELRLQPGKTGNCGVRTYGFRQTLRQVKEVIDNEGNITYEVVVNEFESWPKP